MDRSAIMEIRKLFKYKPGDMAFADYIGCFINTEGTIKGRFCKGFQRESKEIMHKYIDIYKKTLSNNNVDIAFSKEDKDDKGIQFLLEKMRATSLRNEALNNIFFEKIRDSLKDVPNNYVVTVVNYVYDIPLKGKDKLKVDDASSEQFSFIVCSLCPVKTQKGTLGYLPDRELIGENPQLLVVDKPVFGFMYPAFNDRSADVDAASCFRTEDFNISEQLFSHKAPDIVKEPGRDTKKVVLGSPAVIEHVEQESVIDASSSRGQLLNSASVPSLDTGILSNDAHYVKEMLIDEEEDILDNHRQEPSNSSIISSSRSYSGERASSDTRSRRRSVVIRGDLKKVVKQSVNGVLCYVIAVDDADVE